MELRSASQSSLPMWDEHTDSSPHADTPVSFLGQGCNALAHSSQVWKTLLSILPLEQGLD